MAKINKVISIALTSAILFLLILAGPAQAFTLGLSSSELNPEQGDIIEFTAEININFGERLPIDSLTLEFAGPESISCTFDPDGVPVNNCRGISITKLQNSKFGYGYGYGYFNYGYNFGYGYSFNPGTLKYAINLDTSNYEIGTYATEFKVKIKNKIFSKKGNNITIKAKKTSNSGGGRKPKNYYPVKIDNKPKIKNLAVKTGVNTTPATQINLDNRQEPKSNFTSKITGAVIGALGTTGTILAGFFITIIIGLSIAVYFIRRRRY